jgi:hypothetical protein
VTNVSLGAFWTCWHCHLDRGSGLFGVCRFKKKKSVLLKNVNLIWSTGIPPSKTVTTKYSVVGGLLLLLQVLDGRDVQTKPIFQIKVFDIASPGNLVNKTCSRPNAIVKTLQALGHHIKRTCRSSFFKYLGPALHGSRDYTIFKSSLKHVFGQKMNIFSSPLWIPNPRTMTLLRLWEQKPMNREIGSSLLKALNSTRVLL